MPQLYSGNFFENQHREVIVALHHAAPASIVHPERQPGEGAGPPGPARDVQPRLCLGGDGEERGRRRRQLSDRHVEGDGESFVLVTGEDQ